MKPIVIQVGHLWGTARREVLWVRSGGDPCRGGERVGLAFCTLVVVGTISCFALCICRPTVLSLRTSLGLIHRFRRNILSFYPLRTVWPTDSLSYSASKTKYQILILEYWLKIIEINNWDLTGGGRTRTKSNGHSYCIFIYLSAESLSIWRLLLQLVKTIELLLLITRVVKALLLWPWKLLMGRVTPKIDNNIWVMSCPATTATAAARRYASTTSIDALVTPEKCHIEYVRIMDKKMMKDFFNLKGRKQWKFVQNLNLIFFFHVDFYDGFNYWFNSNTSQVLQQRGFYIFPVPRVSMNYTANM